MTGPTQSEMVLLWEERHTKTKPRKIIAGLDITGRSPISKILTFKMRQLEKMSFTCLGIKIQ